MEDVLQWSIECIRTQCRSRVDITEREPLSIHSKVSFDCTNNVAEYEACVLGLQAAIEKKIKSLIVYGDFVLVICQLNGEWETKDSKLVPYQEFIKGLIEQFEEITFKHLSREENYLADALATLATMIKVNANAEAQLVKLEVRESQAHCACI